VILGEDYIRQFRNAFKEDLIIKVLLPRKMVIYERDQKRICWTSGRKTIDDLYHKYLNLMEVIGHENYIDSEHETAEETAERIISGLNE
jgi:hypothetical protein